MIQKKCVRNVCNVLYNAETSCLFKQLGIPKCVVIQVCKFMYAYTNGHLPVTLRNIFVRNTEIHEHNTRHKLDPHVISRNSSAMSKTFIHRGPKLWLGLPLSLKCCIKKHFVAKY